jgi:hypothetical protein
VSAPRVLPLSHPTPYPNPPTPGQSQALQSVLLFCLAALALSSTPFADTLEAARASPSSAPSTPSSTLAAHLQLVFGVVVPGTAVVWAFIGGRALVLCTRALESCGRRPRTRPLAVKPSGLDT